jgi:hypothetical protein
VRCCACTADVSAADQQATTFLLSATKQIARPLAVQILLSQAAMPHHCIVQVWYHMHHTYAWHNVPIHWLLPVAGLLHVFENGCSSPGDGVDDTPYCLAPKDESCPASRDSCPQQPGQDPISNWMSYSVDSCMSSFSAGQLLRAEQMWTRYRMVHVG